MKPTKYWWKSLTTALLCLISTITYSNSKQDSTITNKSVTVNAEFIKKANRVFVERDYLKAENDTLQHLLHLHQNKDSLQNTLLFTERQKYTDLLQISQNQEAIIKAEEAKIINLNLELKKQKREKLFFIVGGVGVGIGVGIMVGAILMK